MKNSDFSLLLREMANLIEKYERRLDRTSEACDIISRRLLDLEADVSELKGEKKPCKIISINSGKSKKS